MDALYGIAGNPVKGSLSPVLHNALLQKYAIDAEYKRFPADNLQAVIGKTGKTLRGLSVTTPLKDQAWKIAEEFDTISSRAKAVNTLSINDDGISAINTDGPAICDIMLDRGLLPGTVSILVIGGGGTARAIAAAAKETGYDPVLAMRNPDKLLSLWNEPPCPVVPLSQTGRVDVLINATSVTNPAENSPVYNSVQRSRAGTYISVHYQHSDSLLKSAAEKRDAEYISGLEMFIFQALRQFSAWHGLSASPEEAREILKKDNPGLFDTDGDSGR